MAVCGYASSISKYDVCMRQCEPVMLLYVVGDALVSRHLVYFAVGHSRSLGDLQVHAAVGARVPSRGRRCGGIGP